MLQKHFLNLYQYDEWANETLIKAIIDLPNRPERADAIISHILLAQKIWYGRFTNNPYQGTVWDAISADEWLPYLQTNMANLRAFIQTLETPADFEQTTFYTNMQKMQFTSTFYDILCHISHHAHYHRGQIVQLCRPLMTTAPATDYIVYSRIKTGQL